jgi:hypothetical protein
MLLVAKRNNITLRSEYASQNLVRRGVPSWPPANIETMQQQFMQQPKYPFIEASSLSKTIFLLFTIIQIIITPNYCTLQAE